MISRTRTQNAHSPTLSVQLSPLCLAKYRVSMLIRADVLELVRRGEVTLAFRNWRRPTVRAGGTLRTAIGVLAIDAVDRIDPDAITAEDARQAGHQDLAELKAWLTSRDGDIYRVALRFEGVDPRVSLRESKPSANEVKEIRAALRRMDERSAYGPWTQTVLRLIAKR